MLDYLRVITAGAPDDLPFKFIILYLNIESSLQSSLSDDSEDTMSMSYVQNRFWDTSSGNFQTDNE